MTTRLESFDSSLALLRRLDPVADGSPTSGVRDALDAVGRAIIRQPHSTSRGRLRPRLKVALVAGILAMVGAGVATAAVVLHAHTGIFASGPNAAVGGPGEELNPAAPDFRSVALKLSADIPYPQGYASWRDFVLTEQLQTSATGPGGTTFPAGVVSTGALRGWFAASAFCAWVQDWRQATISGDTGEAQQAAATIAAAPSWSAVTAEDPHPNPSAVNADGIESGTLFGWLLPYRTAVLAGDRATVDELLANGYADGKCWLADPQWMSELRAKPAWSRLSPQELAQRYQQFLTGTRP